MDRWPGTTLACGSKQYFVKHVTIGLNRHSYMTSAGAVGRFELPVTGHRCLCHRSGAPSTTHPVGLDLKPLVAEAARRERGPRSVKVEIVAEPDPVDRGGPLSHLPTRERKNAAGSFGDAGSDSTSATVPGRRLRPSSGSFRPVSGGPSTSVPVRAPLTRLLLDRADEVSPSSPTTECGRC